MVMKMSDKIRLKGVYEQGYGLSPKLVMRDKNLSIEAKAIYAYMSSFAGSGGSAFPKIETACKDLNISKNRFLKYRKELVDYGYITIEKERKSGKFDNNVYILNNTVASNHRHGKSSPRQNEATNNNKDLNNNSSLNSSSVYDFYQQNFGVLTPFVAESIEHWISDLNESLVIASMERALKNNKKFNYAEGILKDWYRNNIRTLDDVEAKENQFTNKRKTKNKDKEWADF